MKKKKLRISNHENQTTEWGFPKGRVAKTLRGILGPELSDHEVEGVVVSLMSHLLLERRLNKVLYDWLRPDAPIPPEDKKQKKAEEELWGAITKMDFAKKASLIDCKYNNIMHKGLSVVPGA